jgi:hypothetical protein
MEALEKNTTLFTDLIGWEIVGVERFDGRLLVMLSNGESTRMLEIDRYAKIKGIKK